MKSLGLSKTLGLFLLLCAVCIWTDSHAERFHLAFNLQNIVRWIGLFGILSIGAAFVIIAGGIDLSIGSVVCLSGTLLPLIVKPDPSRGFFLFEQEIPGFVAVALVLLLCAAIGLFHGLLITKVRLQPFIVTLCGLLIYRGVARYLTGDTVQGFGKDYTGLRELATGKPMSVAFLGTVLGGLFAAVFLVRGLRRARSAWPLFFSSVALFAVSGLLWASNTTAATDFEGKLGAGRLHQRDWLRPVLEQEHVARALASEYADSLREILAPSPLLIMLAIAIAASVFLHRTVLGRYLFAVGRNEQAARYSGIRTDRVVILAYVVCATLAGAGGVLFALDVNSVQPAQHGNFYELYAIAAAVLGGCSLRGGEGGILGVIIGTALMRVLQNSIVMLEIPSQVEFAIIGIVILVGVAADELVRRLLSARRAARRGG